MNLRIPCHLPLLPICTLLSTYLSTKIDIFNHPCHVYIHDSTLEQTSQLIVL